MARVALAGLFVFACVLTVVSLLGNRVDGPASPWWVLPVILVTGALATFVAMFAFNRRFDRPRLRTRSFEEEIAEMELAGVLDRSIYRATRAFAVEDPYSVSLRYFVELDDGAVLCMVGDYLFDFEPLDEEDGQSRPRRFPCESFEVVRRKDGGWVVDIRPLGRIIEPEMGPEERATTVPSRDLPGDGELISDCSYDELRRYWGLAALSPSRL